LLNITVEIINHSWLFYFLFNESNSQQELSAVSIIYIAFIH
jgi:hypothetical protein